MLYKSSFETAAQSEMVAALFELYLALMRDVKKGIFYSASESARPYSEVDIRKIYFMPKLLKTC